MNQLTIRNLPLEIEEKIKKEAKKNGLSFNKAFILLLKKAFGLSAHKEKKSLYSDLDHLSGIWKKGEAKKFDTTLKKIRTIDEEVWNK